MAATVDKVTAVGSLPVKILACIAAAACVGIGLVGLVVPILPGVLFLAIAGGIIATQFPAVGERLKRHRAFARHMNGFDRWRRVSLSRKLRIAGLLCARLVLDGLAAVGGRLTRPQGRRPAQ